MQIIILFYYIKWETVFKIHELGRKAGQEVHQGDQVGWLHPRLGTRNNGQGLGRVAQASHAHTEPVGFDHRVDRARVLGLVQVQAVVHRVEDVSWSFHWLEPDTPKGQFLRLA